jgi:hypothetical protein
MQIGVDSFGAVIADPATGLTVSALQRMDNLLDEIVLADQLGLDVFASGNTTAASSWIRLRLLSWVPPPRARKIFA